MVTRRDMELLVACCREKERDSKWLEESARERNASRDASPAAGFVPGEAGATEDGREGMRGRGIVVLREGLGRGRGLELSWEADRAW